MKKRVLILYGSVGLGHKSIAENMAGYLEQAGYEVKLADVLKEQEGWLVNAGKKLYGLISQTFPFIWSFLYFNGWLARFLMPYRVKVAAKNSGNIKLLISGFTPDLVISVHSNASAIVAHLKQSGFYRGLFAIGFSDFHLHRFWLYWQADFYLANVPEQKEEMLELGIPAEKIFVCGIILPARANADKAIVKKKFGIANGARVVLVSGGSYGAGLNKELIKKLSSQENLSVVVVCGSNKKMEAALTQELAGTNAKVLGYYRPMEELYGIADIFVTKAGGLSVAEALRYHLPILISYVLPGQEEMNFDYLIEKGLVMPEPINLADEVMEELDTGAFAARLMQNPAVNAVIGDPKVFVEAVNMAWARQSVAQPEAV